MISNENENEMSHMINEFMIHVPLNPKIPKTFLAKIRLLLVTQWVYDENAQICWWYMKV